MAVEAREDYRALARGAARYAAAAGLVAISTIVGLWIRGRWGAGAVDMIYLPAVVAAALWWGVGPAIVAAVGSTLAYNFLFTVPYYSLRIDSAADIVNVAVFFLVAVVISQLAAGIRAEAKRADAHARRNAMIAGFSRQLLPASSRDDVLDVTSTEIATLFDCSTIVLAGLPQPQVIGQSPNELSVTPTDIAAAVHTLRTAQSAGRGTAILSPADWTFYPLGGGREPDATIGVARDDGEAVVAEDKRLLLENILDQAALALSRLHAQPPLPRGRAAAR